MLKHGGITANGHCVAFPQEIDKPVKILPNIPSEINIIKDRKQSQNVTFNDFNVSRYKIQNALIQFKNNNPVYSDIIISEERLNLLPIDGEISIHSVQYDPNTVHINDQGPAPQQIDPEIVDSETVNGIILPEPILNINDSVTKTVKTITSESSDKNPEFTINKKGQITIPWSNRGK